MSHHLLNELINAKNTLIVPTFSRLFPTGLQSKRRHTKLATVKSATPKRRQRVKTPTKEKGENQVTLSCIANDISF